MLLLGLQPRVQHAHDSPRAVCMLRTIGVPVELVLRVVPTPSPAANDVVSRAVAPAVGADVVRRWRAAARIHSLSPTTTVLDCGLISTRRRRRSPVRSASRLGQRGCAQLTHCEVGRLGAAAPPAGRSQRPFPSQPERGRPSRARSPHRAVQRRGVGRRTTAALSHTYQLTCPPPRGPL